MFQCFVKWYHSVKRPTNLDCQHVSCRNCFMVWCQCTFSPVLRFRNLFLRDKFKKKFSSPASYPSLLFSQLSSLFTVWVSKNIYLQVQLTTVFAGIDCLRACLWIEHPATYINIPPSLVSLSPPLRGFLKPCVKSFLSYSELCGMETDVLLHACTWALSDLKH